LPAEFVDRNWLWRRLYIHTGVQANINCFAAFDGMNQPFWISHSCRFASYLSFIDVSAKICFQRNSVPHLYIICLFACT
jgi:hypothetical protein